MKFRKLAISTITLIILCLIAVEFNAVYAHGDETHGEENHGSAQLDISVPLEHMSIIQFKQKLDSVYATVSASYTTVEAMLKKSCYDCHSNQTNYPWYYKIPTIDAMIDSDIKEARKKIDMSNGFPFGGHSNQLKQLAEIRDEVLEGKMPLISYRMMHWGTLIEGEQQDTLLKWIDESTKIIQKAYQDLGLNSPNIEGEAVSE